MNVEVRRVVKVYLSCVLGLIASKLLGYTNMISVCVSAILVSLYGSSNAGSLVRRYIGRRMLVQVKCCVICASCVLLLKHYTDWEKWVIFMAVNLATMPLVLYLDYRFKLSPAYLVTSSVAGLVVMAGTLEHDTYFFRRLLLVFTGCVMGYLLNLLLPCRPPDERPDKEEAGAEEATP